MERTLDLSSVIGRYRTARALSNMEDMELARIQMEMAVATGEYDLGEFSSYIGEIAVGALCDYKRKQQCRRETLRY